MYSLTDAAKAAFKKYHKDAEITFNGTEETREISSSHIWGLELTRASVSGDTIAIGEFNASTLTLTLNNGDGDFSDLKFSGGELYVRIKTTDSDGVTYYMPLGYFLVDSAPRKTKKITVDCYDRAVLFDYTADFTGLTFPATLAQIADYCATQCAGATGMKIATDITALPNGDFEVESAPDDDLTYRQVLMAIAEITGTNARMNAEGNVEFKFYAATGESLTAAERYSHDLYEDDTVITGVSITDEDGEAHTAGADAYAFSIEDNALLTGENVDLDTIAAKIYAAVQSASVDSGSNFYYRAFEAETISLPYIEPLDIITYTEPDGTEHPAIVTNTTFVMNGKGKLEGRSDSSLEQGLSSVGALTAKQKAIIAAVERTASEQISELDEITTARVQALSALNETISNALGLYVSTIDNEDGSTTTIFHNASTLDESTYLFIMTGDGFAYANEWGGSIATTTWTGGIDKNGNAIVNTLTVYQITADQIAANAITTGKIAAGAVTADQIAAGAIKVDKLAAGVLSVENIAYTDNETLADQLKLYVTSSSLTTTLTSYATTSEVENKLESYVTSDSLKTTLSSYVTSGDLSTELKSYVTSSSLTTTLTSYATTSGGTSSSFSYSLTSTDFTLKANGNTVLLADKNGITVTGTVNATSGTIGGLTIAENSISSSNGNFSITSAGVLTATGANITGKITATSGTIGGFTIGSTYLTCSGAMTINSTTGDIKFWKSTATSNGTYANLDGDGLGSVWRGTDNATYPYAYLNAYAEGGLQLVYRPSSSVTTKTFKIHFPYIVGTTTYGYCPRLYSSDNLYFEVPNTIVGGNIYGDSDGEYTLGLSDRYWSDVYVDNLHNGSDRKLKSDIETLSDAYTTLFDNLEPVRYKKNRDKTKRYHTGFIAQNVEEAIITAGLTTEEFACYNYDSDNDMRNLCYDEFIALCVNEIQKLKSRVATLERG